MFRFKCLSTSSLVFGLVLAAMVSLSFPRQVAASTEIETSVGYVPVRDQSQSTRTRAIEQALLNVLIKMTGNPDIGAFDAAQQTMRQANRLLVSYQYQQEGDQLYYVARFDRVQLEQFIQQQQLPLWGRRRPDTLLWIAIEDEQGERFIVGDSSASQMVNTIRSESRRRGISVNVPLMDFEDATSVSVFDVWGRFLQGVQPASKRYGAKYIALARIQRTDTAHIPEMEETAEVTIVPLVDLSSPFGVGAPQNLHKRGQLPLTKAKTAQEGFTREEFAQLTRMRSQGRFVMDWLFTTEHTPISGRFFADTQAELIGHLVDRMADYQGQTFAILPGVQDAQKTLELSVGNLSNLASYAAAEQYLTNLSVVRSVTLKQQNGQVATFNVELLGRERDLRNVLSLESKLTPLRDAFGQAVDGLHFFWNP